MQLEAIPWIILFLPLLATVLIALFTQKDRKVSATLSITAVVAGFILSIIFIAVNGWNPLPESAATWLAAGDLRIDFGLRLDLLSMPMLLVVTGVASVIHIYSWGYMRDDSGFSRFFAFLSLFTFSMLGIVLANNFLQLFIFWELVGVSSYLLIGFWFERPAAADAGKKAFIVNRIGDFGFLLGILMVWGLAGSLNFAAISQKITSNPQAFSAMTIAGLLIFCGAVGKSAQFPLHVWLPDAMEGPTPVSALIHAATMVAAGVFMLCRIIFLLSPDALTVIAWVGGFTALFSAVIAVQQNDIKRILAYSTLSQLGYMVMGVGLGGPDRAMFHLTTHAFFKALLFLAAGSVILALHHEQNIWKMGGLRKKLPVTFWTFMAGTLALAAVWPFSGFFSKDSILAQAMHRHSYFLFGLGVFVAGITAFYMLRLVLIVFFGPAKSDAIAHTHESRAVMLWPLRVLAVLSIFGGAIGLENIYKTQFHLNSAEHLSVAAQLVLPFHESAVASLLGLLATAIGFLGAYKVYLRRTEDPISKRFPRFSEAMSKAFYLDSFYQGTFVRLHDVVSAVATWIDRWIIAGLCVRGTHGTTELIGRALRLAQTGSLQTYAFLFALGVALVLYLALK
jgi:NADH-quinone oxidoreductase subunit L